jgi:hypothetical protein
MKRLSCNISVGSLRFDYVNELHIESTWKNFTDTLTIKFPRNLKLRNTKLQDYIKTGDKVIVNLGYDDVTELIYLGYVKTIKPSTPVEITCEDEALQLKKNPKSLSYRNVSLGTLVNDIASGIIADVFEAQLGRFAIDRATPAQVLEKVKESYGLNSFFRLTEQQPVLVVGKVYTQEITKIHQFKFGHNIIGDSGTLEYRNKEDVRLKIIAISMKPDNTKIEVELGDSDGEERTLTYYDLSHAELKKIATSEMEKLKYDGYSGSFTTFGVPVVRHGERVMIIDSDYPERAGEFYVDMVTTTFGLQGYRQEISLGPKAN